MNTLAAAPLSSPTIAPSIGWLHTLRRRHPSLATAALVFLLAAIPTLFAAAIDARTINDINIWIKPTKFLLSLALYYATLAWFAAYLEPRFAAGASWRRLATVAIVVGAFEMAWLIAAAVLGVPSHFNRTGVWNAAYALAGVGATLLLVVAAVQAVRIGRSSAPRLAPAYRLSIVIGGLSSLVTTLIVAGFLAKGQGHWVGTAASDAAGLPLLGWSRDGGDLRVAHFFATHAMQALPLAGFAATRLRLRAPVAWVWAASLAYLALIAFSFIQALRAQPFLG